MSYNWIKADTAEARERLKARLDSGERIILRSRNGSLSESWLSHDRVVSNTWTRGRYLFNPLILDFLACVSHAEYEFLDPNPAHLSIPSNEAISAASKDFKEMFEAVFASSLRLVAIDSEMLQKGFEAGAKWMVEQMNINQCPAS